MRRVYNGATVLKLWAVSLIDMPVKVTEHLWVLILPKIFVIGFHESIRLVLLSDQVWTKNVENWQSYLIKYISLQ
jgi:hypothetical protein